MKELEIYQLKKGEKVNHKHYGICTVGEVIAELGVTLIPDSKAGALLLNHESGAPRGTALLEHSARLITHRVTLTK